MKMFKKVVVVFKKVKVFVEFLLIDEMLWLDLIDVCV